MRNTSKAKIQSISLNMAQRGIVISGRLSIPTRRQFANEDHAFERSYPTKSIIKALWLYRRDALRFAEGLRNAPGEYDLEPSNFRAGLLWT